MLDAVVFAGTLRANNILIKTDLYMHLHQANIVDPDQTAPNEPSLSVTTYKQHALLLITKNNLNTGEGITRNLHVCFHNKSVHYS